MRDNHESVRHLSEKRISGHAACQRVNWLA
nr:MAG TPA: hypothetical protein [Caudoviricetes sp.]